MCVCVLPRSLAFVAPQNEQSVEVCRGPAGRSCKGGFYGGEPEGSGATSCPRIDETMPKC